MSDQFLAGWASVDITPNKKVLLHGQYFERISEYVNDRLLATALAMEWLDGDGSREQAVLIACDVIGLPETMLLRLREALAGQIPGLDTDKIVISAIHNHTAPYCSEVDMTAEFDSMGWSRWKQLDASEFMSPQEYFAFMVQCLKTVVIEAWETRRPAKVSRKLGHAVVGHCRRVVYRDGSAVMYGRTDVDNFDSIEGPSDHGVELLYFWNMDGKLTGVIVNVACPSQVTELKCFISADYFGAARERIRETFSDRVFVLPQVSAAGDQSPRDLIRIEKSETNMYGLGGAIELGVRVAKAVEEKYESARRSMSGPAEFRHRVERLRLPIRKVTSEEIKWAEGKREEFRQCGLSLSEIKSKHLFDFLASEGIFNRKKLQDNASFVEIEIHAIRLGEVVIVTNPFELFIEYGLRIKARSKAAQTFLVQLACGFNLYLPTAGAIKGGSYSAAIFSGIAGPEGGDLLVERSLEAIESLWDKPIQAR